MDIENLGALTAIERPLGSDGYVFVHADEMRPILERAGLADWQGFAASWNDLGRDGYMADGGRYRQRRHAAFSVGATIRRKPHQPHYQSRDYNALNGGIARWFDPVTDAIAAHPAMTAIISTCAALFDRTTPKTIRPPSWHVEVHQFRIEPVDGRAGKPTPEGMHRDGVDWVLVLLVSRQNIASGVTSIHDAQRRPVGEFTLTEPMDAAFVDDDRVYHGVTAIEPENPDKPAFRDVLVVTFRHE